MVRDDDLRSRGGYELGLNRLGGDGSLRTLDGAEKLATLRELFELRIDAEAEAGLLARLRVKPLSHFG